MRMNVPIRIMHTDRFLSFQNSSLMRHHTGFMEGWLTIQNEDISILKMSVNFLVHSRRPREKSFARGGPKVTILRSQQLVGNSGSLLDAERVLVPHRLTNFTQTRQSTYQ